MKSVLLCKVVGTVVAQQKEECLIGKKLLVCETLDGRSKKKVIAVDMVGAGVGTEVLVSHPSCMESNGYIDDWIVAIVDSVSE